MDGPGIEKGLGPFGVTVAAGRGGATIGAGMRGPIGSCAANGGGAATDDMKNTAAIAAQRYPSIVNLHPKKHH